MLARVVTGQYCRVHQLLFMPVGFRKRRNDLLVETTPTRRRPPPTPVRATPTINRLRAMQAHTRYWTARIAIPLMLIALNAHSQSGWGTSQPIDNGAGASKYADIAVAPSGAAIAVWEQSGTVRSTIWANGYTPGAAGAHRFRSDLTRALQPRPALRWRRTAMPPWLGSSPTGVTVKSGRTTFDRIRVGEQPSASRRLQAIVRCTGTLPQLPQPADAFPGFGQLVEAKTLIERTASLPCPSLPLMRASRYRMKPMSRWPGERMRRHEKATQRARRTGCLSCCAYPSWPDRSLSSVCYQESLLLLNTHCCS